MKLQQQSIIDWELLEKYIKLKIPNIEDQPLHIKQFSEGYSNLTYQISIGNWNAVLRRPPAGPLPPKAHDMKREFEILTKLNKVFPLAPKPYLYCDDSHVMDKHFYIMEKKEGVVIDDALPQQFHQIPQASYLISKALIETLVKLHAINYEEAGLASFGHPEGYLHRQVHGWIKRYHHAKTDELEPVEKVEKWLIENVPTSQAPTIVHNDFKLNNMLFSAQNPEEITGVFDWELSTIGDPLTDLGSVLVYWTEEGDGETGLTSVTMNPGFLSRKEMLELYAKLSGRDVSNIDYYLAFAYYKLAVILQQLYYRWKIGEATDARFEKLAVGIANLMKQADKAISGEILK